jgi:hypothetical protein
VAHRSPLLQYEVFEELYAGLGVHSADLLQRRRLIFRFLSTLCGAVSGQQLRKWRHDLCLGKAENTARDDPP